MSTQAHPSSAASGVPTLWTIGHSTRSLEELLALLARYSIAALADVRRFPGSRRYPHFQRDALAVSLPAHHIAYQWFPRLGGRRPVLPGSRNTAWHNASFQGYADYMESAEFAEGLAALLEFARGRRTVVMCAEAVWWRCHRAMLADLLCVRGVEVIHILDAQEGRPHPYTAPARVLDGRLTYEADAGEPLKAGKAPASAR